MHTVFLYQMGRVGSTSINNALHNAGVETLHAHWMTNYHNAEFPTPKFKIVKNIKEGKTPPLKVIVPIREPISRNISAFFHHLDKFNISSRNASLNELYDAFLYKYNKNYPDLWFKYELMTVFNFSPFSKTFDYKKGYKIYKAGKHSILIIRLEDINKILSEAIYKLLKIKNIEILKLNSFGTKKYIGHIYKQFSALKFPVEFVNNYYKMEYARYFWSKEEIKKYKALWCI